MLNKNKLYFILVDFFIFFTKLATSAVIKEYIPEQSAKENNKID